MCEHKPYTIVTFLFSWRITYRKKLTGKFIFISKVLCRKQFLHFYICFLKKSCFKDSLYWKSEMFFTHMLINSQIFRSVLLTSQIYSAVILFFTYKLKLFLFFHVRVSLEFRWYYYFFRVWFQLLQHIYILRKAKQNYTHLIKLYHIYNTGRNLF